MKSFKGFKGRALTNADRYFVGGLIGVIIGILFAMVYVYQTYGFWIK